MASTAGLARVALLRGGQRAAVFKVFQGGLQFAQHRFAATDVLPPSAVAALLP